MGDPRHSKQTVADGIHTAISYEYADASARTGASGFTAEDVHKLAFQIDDSSVWILTATTPTWALVTNATSPLVIKSGVLVPGAFSGNPKVATVAFGSSFSTSSYAVTLSALTDGTKNFGPVAFNKTTSGFQVDLGANNIANLVELGWHAIENGS